MPRGLYQAAGGHRGGTAVRWGQDRATWEMIAIISRGSSLGGVVCTSDWLEMNSCP